MLVGSLEISELERKNGCFRKTFRKNRSAYNAVEINDVYVKPQCSVWFLM